MAQTAPQAKFRAETIAGFEKGQSVLSKTVTTEANINGISATFLVADTGGATAVKRGLNGKIPGRPDNLNQFTATLEEFHDKPQRTDFNIYTSQGDGRRIMQEGTRKVINRTVDINIREALDLTPNTLDDGAVVMTLARVQRLTTILANANVDGMIYAAITPAVRAFFMGFKEFASIDYISDKKFDGVQKLDAFNWYGVNWIVDTDATGIGTADASCYIYSENAIGHAVDTENMKVLSGYEEEDDYSWARCSTYMGSKMLQSSGVWKFRHDDSSFSA